MIYYSMYGHIKQMADEFVAGAKEAGMEVDVFQAPETLPTEVLEKMGAPPQNADIPLMDYANIAKLPEYDGIAFGIPTRFGMMPAQLKAVFDSMGQLWQAGALNGKPATAFFCTGTQGGGQETTALTVVTQFVHLGLIYVPTGYTFGGKMFDNSTVHGGSPYGAGTYAGADGSRQPSDMEKEFAAHHGKYFATTAKELAKGRA